ncbi:MAG: SpoIIE family protein phosphatase [Myxococcales bacterium]|nr:SpoIIE family protein phosphatase [Myxococcales bacterium]
MPAARRKFRTKFILAAGLGVFVGLSLSVAIAVSGFSQLERESAGEIERGLKSSSAEYLENHLEDTAAATSRYLAEASANLEMASTITQDLIDHEAELAPLFEFLSEQPTFRDDFTYNEVGDWRQNDPKEPAVVAVWGYLLDAEHQIKPEVRRLIQRSALLDAVLPGLEQHGADKLQMYYVGPKEAPFVRLTPNIDMASAFDQLYPGHNAKPFWEFFFPGLVESWELWRKHPADFANRPSDVTITAPYEDAAGGGLILTLFHPLWDKARARFEGAIGVDITLKRMIEQVEDVRLAETGFAFLIQEGGNVLAVNEAGEDVLQLRHSKGDAGVSVLERKLESSLDPMVASLTRELPRDDKVHSQEVFIGEEAYLLALRRLDRMNMWTGEVGTRPEHWTLAFLVPKNEIYAALYASQATVAAKSRSIISSQVAITLGTLLTVLLGIALISRRITSSLVALSKSANEIMHKNYDVEVDVASNDEVGQLAEAFNKMVAEIREYTQNLEGLVRQRTLELEKANAEILSLNKRLRAENVRMAAELDVARRLQLMVLPHEQELRELPALDVAAYMAPADEVGGDYYDILRSPQGVMIGIGDVTGHGLESGVLMLMVQAAVRTLLASEERDPRRFLSIINKVVYQNVQRINLDRNLTLMLLDYSDRKLTLTGQHEEVIVVRAADGQLERIDTMALGLPVGLELDIHEFVDHTEIALAPGDVVVLYTDGITEAEDVHNVEYGVERLCEIVRQNYGVTAREIKDAVIADVTRHIGDQKVYDDITLVVIKQR